MPFNFHTIPATIKALTKFVQVLEQYPRGTRRLIVLMVTTGALVMLPQLPAALHQAGPAPVATSTQR